MENNKELIALCEEKAQQWLSPAFDEETRNEVKAMLEADDKSALVDAFYQNLEFGTGGLRGIMGAGTNRMNKYIVGMAATVSAKRRELLRQSCPTTTLSPFSPGKAFRI